MSRWRSCGAGDLAWGTQSSQFERRPRYTGGSDEGRLVECEVRVCHTSTVEKLLQGPPRVVQSPGGLMVRSLSLAGCELASDEALATLLRVTDLNQLCIDRCVHLADAQPSLRRDCRVWAPSPSCAYFRLGVSRAKALRRRCRSGWCWKSPSA